MKVLLANLRSSGAKLWAAGAAITISVAFIVTGILLVDSFTRGITEEAEAQVAGTDLIINTGPLGNWYEPEAYASDDVDIPETAPDEVLASAVGELDQVSSAEAIGMASLEQLNEDGTTEGGVPVEHLAAAPPDYEITAGRAPESAEEVLLSSNAEEFDLAVGDTLSALDYPQVPEDGEPADPAELPRVDYTAVGVADISGQPRGFLTEAGMQRLPSPAEPKEIRVLLTDEAHGDSAAQAEVQAEIAALIDEMVSSGQLQGPFLEPEQSGVSVGEFGITDAAGFQVATNSQVVDQWVATRTGDADVLMYIALGFGGISVFVAGLVISTTFQVLVSSRLRTMALLRAVGATAAQLRRATLAEGAVLGLAGGLAGLLLGYAGAVGLAALVELLDWQPLPTVQPTVPAVAAGLGLGLVMAMISALMPALRAGRVTPVQALQPADTAPARPRPPVWRIIAGSVLTVVGLGAVLYAAVVEPPPTERGSISDNVDPVLGLPLPLIGAAAAVVGFVGVLLLGRLIFPWAVATLGRAGSGLPGRRVLARLAGQNARRVPGRTTATSTALLVGVTLVVTMTVGAATAQKLLYTELAESYPVDGVADVDEETREELLSREEISAGVHVPGAEATLQTPLGSEEARVLVLDNETAGGVAYRDLDPGAGTVLVAQGMVFGEQALVAEEGENLELTPYGTAESGAAEQTVELEAEIASWVPEGVVVISESALPQGASGDSGPWSTVEEHGVTLLQVVEGAGEPELFSLTADFADAGEVNVNGGFARASNGQVIDMVLGAVLLLLGASVVVAVIGVSNTLSLSVVERRREAALMRAVGMTRRSLGQMLSLEALLMALSALLLGTGLGVFFGWAGVSSLAALEDWDVVVQLPWPRLGLIWAVTLLAALLAAWLPARQLSRTPPAAGLAA